MPLIAKSDTDWYALLTQQSLCKPLWVLFAKDGTAQSTVAKALINQFSVSYPQIKFIFIDMNQNPDATSAASVLRNVTHIQYVCGIELKRFWGNECLESGIAQNLIDSFWSTRNFLSSKAVLDLSVCDAEEETFDGTQIVVGLGQFSTVEELTFEGAQPSIDLGQFETIDVTNWNGVSVPAIEGQFGFDEEQIWSGRTVVADAGSFEGDEIVNWGLGQTQVLRGQFDAEETMTWNGVGIDSTRGSFNTTEEQIIEWSGATIVPIIGQFLNEDLVTWGANEIIANPGQSSIFEEIASTWSGISIISSRGTFGFFSPGAIIVPNPTVGG
jgi:hypothetical protein